MEVEDEDIEVPQYFTCPISLQIMKDPVTAITGITYDRESIEHWLFSTENTTCPVTKQPLPPDSDLTPNHTLRRLIQSWCSDNSSHGVPRIPTPNPPLNKPQILSLLRDLTHPRLHLRAVRRLASLAADNPRNVAQMLRSGAPDAVFAFVSTFCRRGDRTEGLEDALTVLRLLLLRPPGSSDQPAVACTDSVMDSLAWVLSSDRVEPRVKADLGVHVLRSVVGAAARSPGDQLARLRPEFFASVVGVLRGRHALTRQAVNAALEIMMEVAPHKNQANLAEGGAVAELVEVELGNEGATAESRRRTTELVFGVLQQLCGCADGRARLVGHGGGVAVVAERILSVSPSVDDRAVTILSLICRFSGTKQVMREMLEVGAVKKLCSLLHVECSSYLKDRVRDILKLHSLHWKHSPCIGHRYPN